MSATLRIPAEPFTFELAAAGTALVVIDMQRDFIEPGGFGASLGNDVSLLQAAIGPIAALLAAWRARSWPVLHTRECHRPDGSDLPPAKRDRGAPTLRIGDPGPMGRVLIAGEPGSEIIAALAPVAGEWVVDKPGKGMFWGTGLHERLQAAGITHLLFTGVTTEVCVQTQHARGQRPRLRVPGGGGRDRELLPGLQAGGAGDDHRAGRHRGVVCDVGGRAAGDRGRVAHLAAAGHRTVPMFTSQPPCPNRGRRPCLRLGRLDFSDLGFGVS